VCVLQLDNQLILRESAQCAKADEGSFQDVSRHRFFNTNNLWVRLDLLRDLMASKGGFVPLPTIMNSKTVDPQNDKSNGVYQLETAMGAAIECFAGLFAVHYYYCYYHYNYYYSHVHIYSIINVCY
jgi:UDP-N-acetylglucosamine pyrophosphorylase